MVVRGDLQPATSEVDIVTQLALALAAGMDTDKPRYLLLDQYRQKARTTRFKLVVREV